MPRPTLSPFLKALTEMPGPFCFNPWRDHDPTTDRARAAPKDRLERLRAHFATRPEWILIGEAPGYQGCKVSGIPFTSERLILEGLIPRVTASASRLSTRERPWSEPCATMVWQLLHTLDRADTTLLWNAYPWHPHKEGRPHSNRPPTQAERERGLPILAALLNAFPKGRLFALGRQSQLALGTLGRDFTPVRHPSMGGRPAFRGALAKAAR